MQPVVSLSLSTLGLCFTVWFGTGLLTVQCRGKHDRHCCGMGSYLNIAAGASRCAAQLATLQ